MDIENNRISGRQLGRMVFYDYFALTILVLPGIVAKAAGMDGFFALAAGCAAGYGLFLLVLVSMKEMRRDGKTYDSYLRGYLGSFLTTMILLAELLTALFGAAYGLHLLCVISRQYLIRETPAWLVLAILTGLAVYALSAGIESRGRMYELLFWFVLIPLLLLFFLAAHNVEADRWVPVFCTEGAKMFKSSYVVFAFFAGSVFLPMLMENVSERANAARVIRQGFLFSTCANLILFLLLTGIFGARTVATMDEAVVTLTAMVKIPGGFFERQDALLCAILLVSMFAFVENMFGYAFWCVKKISVTIQSRSERNCEGIERSPKSAHRWCLLVAGAVLYALAVCMQRSRSFRILLARIYLQIVVPVLVGMVLVVCMLSLWNNRRRHRKKAAVQHRQERDGEGTEQLQKTNMGRNADEGI